MSFEVIFKYKNQPGYALDLKNAPFISSSSLLETITGVAQQSWSPGNLILCVKEPTSIGKIVTAALATIAFLAGLVACAIFFPKAGVIIGLSFLTLIPAGLTWAGIADRKEAFQLRDQCRDELNRLGKIVGDNKEKLLEAAKRADFQYQKDQLHNLVKFFFPQQ